MGTRASKEQVKVNHFLFNEVTLKNEFNKELITWYKPMVRVDEFIEWEVRYKKAVTMNKESLLLPQNYDKAKIPKYFMCCECPADTEIALTYEKFDFTLAMEIETRKTSGNYFQQNQLFFIMYKLLEGCKEFQLRDEHVGDIRPAKIVKSKNGELKLINVASFPQEVTPIEKITEQYDNKTVFYLAPEEIEYLKSKGYNMGKFPNAKSEAFSLGLTILECASLRSSAELYKLGPNLSINLEELNLRLINLSQRCPKLSDYLRRILNPNAQQRLSTGEMWASLNSYAAMICQLKEFSPKDSSEKLGINEFKNKMAKIKTEKNNDF